MILKLSAKKKKGISLIHFSMQLPNVCCEFQQSRTSASVNLQSAFDFNVLHQLNVWLPRWITATFKISNEVGVYPQPK